MSSRNSQNLILIESNISFTVLLKYISYKGPTTQGSYDS